MTRHRPHPLDQGHPPAWASSWGEDRFGPFTAFAVGDVEQRLRWISPGTFWMGSPEEEQGRDSDETRHRVTLTEGFWLADTPCTQALWEAVTGESPSRFESPDRPVEQVSWEEVRSFLADLGDRVPGLAPRLPTEAEWEYACRAGTETATWVGDLQILGAHNAPALDAIAWHGGNSDKDFDLETGYDSSGWVEKQAPHTRAGTHPVALKRPNPWGLYDMLGNVWEWCEDWYAPSYSLKARHSRGPNKVIRGGSWFSAAQHVHAAFRGHRYPSDSRNNLGFRLARGQV